MTREDAQIVSLSVFSFFRGGSNLSVFSCHEASKRRVARPKHMFKPFMTPVGFGKGVPFIGEVLTQKAVLYIYTESLSIQVPPKVCSASEL